MCYGQAATLFSCFTELLAADLSLFPFFTLLTNTLLHHMIFAPGYECIAHLDSEIFFSPKTASSGLMKSSKVFYYLAVSLKPRPERGAWLYHVSG